MTPIRSGAAFESASGSEEWSLPRQCSRRPSLTTPVSSSGVLVTAAGDVIEFGFDYLNVDKANGAITEWTAVTDRWRDRPSRADVAKAFDVLASGASGT